MDGEVKFVNDENFEVVVAMGNIKGLSRKLLVIGCYIPPNYNLLLDRFGP